MISRGNYIIRGNFFFFFLTRDKLINELSVLPLAARNFISIFYIFFYYTFSISNRTLKVIFSACNLQSIIMILVKNDESL